MLIDLQNAKYIIQGDRVEKLEVNIIALKASKRQVTARAVAVNWVVRSVVGGNHSAPLCVLCTSMCVCIFWGSYC